MHLIDVTVLTAIVSLNHFGCIACIQVEKRTSNNDQGKFEIDATNNQFLLNGKPFRFISGTLHYFRIPEKYWEDRVVKLRAMGLNAVQLYVEWNMHEPYRGKYEFKGIANIEKFINICHKLGIYVVLRPGPYIDANQDMGGYPAWLLNYPKLQYKPIHLRTSDPVHLKEVKRWFDVLLPKIKPLLITNGGPIIMVQVENEYGSYYACDHNYTSWLRDLLKQHLGEEIVYFTVNGGYERMMECGTVPGTFPAVDFRPSNHSQVDAYMALQRKYAKGGGPFYNPEFYTGWFTEWNQTRQTVDAGEVLDTTAYLYSKNASFNYYVACGGTNWGFSGGSDDIGGKFESVLTSHDYDAPISEGGDLTPKWFAIRQQIERLQGHLVPYPVPQTAPKVWYGNIRFRRMGSLFTLLEEISNKTKSKQSVYPMSVEDADFYYGFVRYHTTISSAGLLQTNTKCTLYTSFQLKSELHFSNLNDRGYVFINHQLTNIFQRPVNATVNITADLLGDSTTIDLDILIENQGRICYGTHNNDSKGLLNNVTHTIANNPPIILTNWTLTHLEIHTLIQYLSQRTKPTISEEDQVETGANGLFLPGVYVSEEFDANPIVGDTYLDTTGWGKGQAYVGTGQNLGRYWPLVGPQMTLYHPFIQKRRNKVVLFELEKANCAIEKGHEGECSARLVNNPIWSK